MAEKNNPDLKTTVTEGQDPIQVNIFVPKQKKKHLRGPLGLLAKIAMALVGAVAVFYLFVLITAWI